MSTLGEKKGFNERVWGGADNNQGIDTVLQILVGYDVSRVKLYFEPKKDTCDCNQTVLLNSPLNEELVC